MLTRQILATGWTGLWLAMCVRTLAAYVAAKPGCDDVACAVDVGRGLPVGVDDGVINARSRYLDPARKRAGVPEDVGHWCYGWPIARLM